MVTLAPVASSVVRQLERACRENSREALISAHEQLRGYASDHGVEPDWPGRVLRQLAQGVRVPTNGNPLPVLTPAELAVLRCAADGIDGMAAAQRLGRTPASVDQDREAVRIRLGAATTAQAVAIAIRLGLV